MSRHLRWVTLGLLGLNLLLLQVIRHQATELTTVHAESAAAVAATAELRAEMETAKYSLAVRNVLDNNHINVPADQKQAIADTVLEIADRFDLEPELILAVIFTESRFDIAAESHVGAIGLMQLMPSTAVALALELELEWKGRQLLTDPQINILMGSFYLRQLIHRFDDVDTALAAYNVGPTRLRSLIATYGRTPGTPRRYADRVLRISDSLRSEYFD